MDVVKLALAGLPESDAVPKTFDPSMNVTVPVGLVPVTLDVRVTDDPETEGLDDDVSTVLVILRVIATAFEVADAGPVPTAFVAVTVKA
jgi:hypothetical protein